MDNPVVIRVAEVAQSLGGATLRFDFRGVGASSGKHGGGEAEQEDVKAALGSLAERLPAGSFIGLAGYSFGAWVAARIAAAVDLPALALVAPPLGMYDLDFLARAPGPALLVAGTKDQYSSRGPSTSSSGSSSRLERRWSDGCGAGPSRAARAAAGRAWPCLRRE